MLMARPPPNHRLLRHRCPGPEQGAMRYRQGDSILHLEVRVVVNRLETVPSHDEESQSRTLVDPGANIGVPTCRVSAHRGEA
jgi:hypothetical protein